MNLIAKFFKIISSETNPWQIAFAIMLGMMVGISPLMRLHNVVIVFLVLFFRINIATFLLAIAVFSGVAIALDPLLISVGESILTSSGAESTWQVFYNSSFGRLSQFNHTLTMGSFVTGLAMAIPLLLLSKAFVVQYRDKIMVAVNKMQIVRMLRASTFFQRMSGLGD
ncbi:TIGR03546 family protein [Teredinibacter purpureus]|uniref:TIGR03546 family protein n=1 Tax=Teredinibacter purpureus TaxID=2731756 RepID=UPI0005F785A7|nr:TIGR03546 family protein [Teredinibacter purpureus]